MKPKIPYCEQCGFKCKESDKFCTQCGAKINSTDIKSNAIIKPVFKNIDIRIIFASSLLLIILLIIIGSIKLGNFKDESTLAFFENFESYENQEPINGKPNWTSSDIYHSLGWLVEGNTFKYIHFHPTPWPGGFQIGSNYATYHVKSQGKIDSLYLDIRYSILPNSDMKVFISGDNKIWVDVTKDIGMRRSSKENEWKNARGDLSSRLASANAIDDLYIKFTAAAYSGSGWGAHIDEIKVTFTKKN